MRIGDRYLGCPRPCASRTSVKVIWFSHRRRPSCRRCRQRRRHVQICAFALGVSRRGNSLRDVNASVVRSSLVQLSLWPEILSNYTRPPRFPLFCTLKRYRSLDVSASPFRARCKSHAHAAQTILFYFPLGQKKLSIFKRSFWWTI